MRAARSSESARIRAAVEQDALPRAVAGFSAAQEGADLAELLERAVALGGDSPAALFLQLLDRLARLRGLTFQRGLDAVGVEHAGQQVVDRHVARGQARLTCQPGDEAG